MRTLGRLISIPIFLASLTFSLLVVTTPPSLSGFGYATALVVVSVACFFQNGGKRRRIALGGALLFASTMGLRLLAAGHGNHLALRTPYSQGARWVDRVIDEEDLAVNGARALAWTGLMGDRDAPQLADVMRGAYARMRAEEGATPSPVLATYLGLEGPSEDDTLEIGDVAHANGVVVFLHGYAGSFTLPCWVVSRAAADAGFATVCPSIRWVGDWWSASGEATLRETLAGLRERGVKRFVLAGLSNGGVGASLLANRMRGAFDGVIVISGASPAASSPGVPVLAIQGAYDRQISAAVVHAYAERVGGHYLELDAAHFAMLIRERETTSAITTFLRERSLRGAIRTAARENRP